LRNLNCSWREPGESSALNEAIEQFNEERHHQFHPQKLHKTLKHFGLQSSLRIGSTLRVSKTGLVSKSYICPKDFDEVLDIIFLGANEVRDSNRLLLPRYAMQEFMNSWTETKMTQLRFSEEDVAKVICK
jgi:hypothetical protein